MWPFKKYEVDHLALGSLVLRLGRLHGVTSIFGFSNVCVRLRGNKNGLSDESDKAIKRILNTYKDIEIEIFDKLYSEHYLLGKDAFDRGEIDYDFPLINKPSDIKEHVRLVRLTVGDYSDKGLLELAYEVDWDIEHRLGILVKDRSIVGFCGSVGP